MFKVNAVIYVDPNEPEDDPEDIATRMNQGLGSALAGFPDGEIAKASVVTIERVEQDELEAEGLTE